MTWQQETTITVSRSPRFGALWQFCKIRAQRSSFQLWMMLFNTIASARRGTDSKKLPPILRGSPTAADASAFTVGRHWQGVETAPGPDPDRLAWMHPSG